jgi:hypothetical protein
MRRETAYKLAGRNHDHAPHTISGGVIKRREIRFSEFPPEQTTQAWRALAVLKGVKVERGDDPHTLVVHYSVLDYTLESLEAALMDAGFHLEETLLMRIHHALIHYVEDTQVHNLRSPERLIKQSHQVYIKAYDAHPHGDHDDTPIELREYR